MLDSSRQANGFEQLQDFSHLLTCHTVLQKSPVYAVIRMLAGTQRDTDQQQSLFSHPVRWLAAVTASAAFGSEHIDERSSGAGTREQVVCERQR